MFYFSFINFFVPYSVIQKGLKGRKGRKIGTQAYFTHRNSLKLNWVSLVLAWMIFTEVVEYVIHCQERILNSAN